MINSDISLKPSIVTRIVIQYLYLIFDIRYIKLMKETGNLDVR